MTCPIVIVQGAQWGSEAKGAVALFLCEKLGIDYAVRTGSINAGHTIVKDGHKIAFQQLPTGAILPSVVPVLGPGTYVHHETMKHEAEIAGCADRLLVDRNCGVHLDDFQEEASDAGRNLKIGATGKGCAEAVIHKIKDRGVGVPLLYRNHNAEQVNWCDAADLLTSAYKDGKRILLEGTQGTLLDLHTGPYPFTTSRQTTAAAWVAEAGLSPALDYEVALVARTYPIRVAGNSGPMENEITWPELARRINRRLNSLDKPSLVLHSAIEEFEDRLRDAKGQFESPREASLFAATEAIKAMSEHGRREIMNLFETTTVTKRLRRIAELDVEQLRQTVKKEAASYLVLTFLNYQYPELAGSTAPLHREATVYVRTLEERIGCWIKYVSVGPRSEDVLEVA